MQYIIVNAMASTTRRHIENEM